MSRISTEEFLRKHFQVCPMKLDTGQTFPNKTGQSFCWSFRKHWKHWQKKIIWKTFKLHSKNMYLQHISYKVYICTYFTSCPLFSNHILIRFPELSSLRLILNTSGNTSVSLWYSRYLQYLLRWNEIVICYLQLICEIKYNLVIFFCVYYRCTSISV